MKQVSMIMLLLFISSSLFAQFEEQAAIEKSINEVKTEAETTSLQHRNSRMNSNYLDINWIEGFRVDENLEQEERAFYRYDVLHDRIERMQVVEPEPGKVYVFGGRFFTYADYITLENAPGRGYFEILVKGGCMLLLRRSVNFKSGTRTVQAYGSEPSKDVEKTYYLKFDGDIAQQIDKDKELLINSFPNYQAKIEKFVKRKFWFGIWSQKQLKDLVDYYNGLQAGENPQS